MEIKEVHMQRAKPAIEWSEGNPEFDLDKYHLGLILLLYKW